MAETDKNNLIIVTYDFTEQADCALNHASFIAKNSGADVALVHIINSESKSKFKSGSQTAEQAITDKLEAVCKRNFQETGIHTLHVAREGSIFSTIAEVTAETKAKLVVLGTHGVRGMQHVLGAFALKVVTSSPAPVLIVQTKKVTQQGYETIVLPVDESVETKQKTNQAIIFAKEFKSTVNIFSKNEKDEYLKIKISANSNFVKNEMLAEGITCVESLEPESSKSFSKEVIKYSTAINAGMIVITTKTEKEITDIFVGDEDVKIVNNESQIPVLCVNAKNYNILGSAISFGGFN